MARTPDIDTPEGRAWLARLALVSYAESLRRRAQLRAYGGPHFAEYRAETRRLAHQADVLADLLKSGEMTVDRAHGSVAA